MRTNGHTVLKYVLVMPPKQELHASNVTTGSIISHFWSYRV